MKQGDRYVLYSEGGHKFACTSDSPYKRLSIKNCQAIERGYDLDELAWNQLGNGSAPSVGGYESFIRGFQKALEILGDKKFSEDDMMKFGEYVWKHGGSERSMNQLLDDYKAPQQTEFDVEVVMENVYSVNNGETEMMPKLKTKLDPNGCLILKRI